MPPTPGFGPPMPPPPPRRNHTALIAAASAVVAAAVAVAVTVAVTRDGKDEAAPAPTVTVTQTVGADEPVADEEDTEPAPEEPADDGILALDETRAYDGGVSVSLAGFKRAVSTDTAIPESAPYLRFTVKLKNDGKKTLDATLLTVNCAYGKDGRPGEAVFDSAGGLSGGPSTKLLAGRSLSITWGCELPKGEKVVQIEVAPDYELDAAVFTGSVK
ncbi:hypothetical protein [Streptomyces sp. NPDC003717]|uniref:hypothetical protein n=1 Tax=Streptomyces sp. NPDC003717 TaxID=3154276 RepID=UPI0033A8757E